MPTWENEICNAETKVKHNDKRPINRQNCGLLPLTIIVDDNQTVAWYWKLEWSLQEGWSPADVVVALISVVETNGGLPPGDGSRVETTADIANQKGVYE